MNEATWLEVSLTVDGEMAEAVAEIMARYIPGGVVIESTAIDTSSPDSPGFATGPMRVFGYLPLESGWEDKRRLLEESLWYLSRIRQLPAPAFRPIKETNWAENWKQHYRPIQIGQNLIIIPAWLDEPAGGRIPIQIDPGMAFGTGAHPTTQLCLELIEELIYLDQPEQVIDLGCGSAILSIAAIKLGVRRALGVDNDGDAIQAAAENASLNDVRSRLELAQGSLPEIQAGAYFLQQAPLVIANILAPVIVRLLEAGLGNLLTPGGKLILSGILEEQMPDIEAALLQGGLQPITVRKIDDWVALRRHTSRPIIPNRCLHPLFCQNSGAMHPQPLRKFLGGNFPEISCSIMLSFRSWMKNALPTNNLPMFSGTSPICLKSKAK